MVKRNVREKDWWKGEQRNDRKTENGLEKQHLTNLVCNPLTNRPDPRYPYKTEWSDTGEIIYHVPVIADSADALITLNA